jgi:hypothetical protein
MYGLRRRIGGCLVRSKRLGWPTLNDIKDKFEQLADELGVKG